MQNKILDVAKIEDIFLFVYSKVLSPSQINSSYLLFRLSQKDCQLIKREFSEKYSKWVVENYSGPTFFLKNNI